MNDIFTWVEDLVGGCIIEKEQQHRWRRQWFLTVETVTGERLKLMLRGYRDAGIMGDDTRHRQMLRYEAAVLRAVQDTSVAVPRYYGYHDEEDWILMECVPGVSDPCMISDPSRSLRVVRNYIENLAALHSLDYKKLKLPKEMPVPRTQKEIVLGTLLPLEAIYRSYNLKRPDPLIEFALWWVHRNIPDGRDEVCLLQGDTGPYQFMHDGDRVTALIDWEFAHLGDPFEDLGCMRMRDILYPTGNISKHIQYYGDISNRPIDWNVIKFHTTVWLLWTPMILCDKTQRPDVSVPENLAIIAWDAVMRRGLCESLMEAMGLEAMQPELPVGAETPRTHLYDLLKQRLTKTHAQKIMDPFESFQFNATASLADTLVLADRMGSETDAMNQDDLAEVLGVKPSSTFHGLSEISKLVQENPEGYAGKLLPLFYRMQCRHERICEPIIRGADVAYGIPLQRLDEIRRVP